MTYPTGNRVKGWANFSTYAVAQYLDNEESRSYWAKVADECWSSASAQMNDPEGTWTRFDAAVTMLANRLQENVCKNAIVSVFPYNPYAEAILRAVDWTELAIFFMFTSTSESAGDPELSETDFDNDPF